MRSVFWLIALAGLLSLALWATWRWAPGYLPAPMRGLLDERLSDPAPAARAPEQHVLYRWRDAAGQWVISDQPPSEEIPYERVLVDPRTNVLPAVVDED